ncbi:hypothetical protein [Fusobacterium gastrosuis]|nr:hypothetical protein [Fusobacteriaceae bacterium]MDY5712380.1 hypothetical protein [Fusobacterium gastrosuis]
MKNWQEIGESGMTNEQYKIQLKMIIELIKSSENKEEAVKKIEALLDD